MPYLCLWLSFVVSLFISQLSTNYVSKYISNVENSSSYTDYVKEVLDNLIEYGTDRYGEVHTPMLVSIIDIDSLTCPKYPDSLDEYYRVTRRERRNPAGSNMLSDQPLLKVMRWYSNASGNNKYADFASDYERYVLENLIDKKGFVWWGWHRHYDVYKDQMNGHAGNHHEIHALFDIDWESLWTTNPTAVSNEIEAIWNWQVIDKETGEINRHGDGKKGCDFTMSAGAIITSFAFIYSKTKDSIWLDRALLIANYNWKNRNLETNLLPERPNAGTERFDGSTFVTSIPGLYCYSLLRAYDLTKHKKFLDQSLCFLDAYHSYGYDNDTGKFWGALRLDGTPIPGPRFFTDNIDSKEGYLANQPRGHLDLWEPYVLGYQYAIYTAQAYVYAYHLSGNEDMLVAAHKFANWIISTPPGSRESVNTWYKGYSDFMGTKGTYAGKYGRTISFMIHLYLLTGDNIYKQEAIKYANEAIDKLYYKGFLRGHPSKNYYEAIDGAGFLLYALLKLDFLLQDTKGAVEDNSIYLPNGIRMSLQNW